MGCLPSQAAVIVGLTWLCVLTASAVATLEETCDPNNSTCNTTGNEICESNKCVCISGYFNVNGVCKSDAISISVPLSPSVVYGSTVTLTGTILSEVPVGSVIWQRVMSDGNLLVDTSNEKYTLNGPEESGTISLTIKNVDFTDKGTYQVYVNNTAGNANTSNHVSVTVTGAAPTDVMINVSKNAVNHGDSVTFTGSYTSDPPVTEIKWQKHDGNEYKNISITESSYEGSTNSGPNPQLVIKSVMFIDETMYRLLVSNGVGSNSSNEILLDVTGELTVTTGANVTGRLGENVTVNCTITGPEKNSVLWKKFTLGNTNVVNLTTDGTKYTGGSVSTPALTINNLQKADAAEYQCTASNPGGSYSSSNKATVVLYGEFDEDCAATQLCDPSKHLVCSNNRCLCNYSTFYHKNKTCYQNAGLTPSVTNISGTLSQFYVSWSSPTTHSDLVTGYEVQWRPRGNSTGTSGQLSSTKQSYTASSGLMHGQQYTVVVIAFVNLTNPDMSLTLNSSDQTVRLDTSPPGPIKKNESNFTHDHLQIVWTAPSNTFVTIYEVTFEGKVRNTSNDTPSISLIENLLPGKTYPIKIVTISGTTNVKRSSPHPDEIRTTPTNPGPPTDLRCTQELGKSIEISWTAPSNPNGRIKHYQINISLSPGGQVERTITTPTNATEFKVDNLDEEQEYTFTVSTVNDAADPISNANAFNKCKTKAGASEPPTKLNVINVQSREFEIKFEAPEDVKGVLAAYKIYISDKKNCVQLILVYGTEECPNCTSKIDCQHAQLENFTVTNISLPVAYPATGLNPYTDYLVEVAAINGQGEGDRANATAMTEEEIPLKPEKITAEIFNATSLTLSWNIPDPSPGNTTYTIYVYESTDDKETSFTLNQTLKSYGFISKSVQVYDLEEYWPYYFEVDAATMKGNNKSDRSTTVRTSQAAPGMVVGLSVNMKGEDYRKAYVSWSLPPLREHNGVLKNYIFKSNFSGNSDEYYIPVNLSRQKEERIFDVIPETVYEIEVALENNKSEKGKPSKNFYTAKAGPPPKSDEAVIETIPGHHAPTTTTITVNFDTELFKNDSNGRVVFFGIAVCAQSKCDDSDRNKEEWKSLRNWHKAKGKGFLMYRATNDTYMDLFSKEGSRKKRSASNDPSEFIVGEDATCPSLGEDTYCNGPLDPGISYRVIIFACTNGGCTQSDSNGYYATNMKPEDKPFPLGIVVGVACAVVAVALVIGAVIIFRSRRSSLGRTKSYTKGLHDPPDTEDPVSKNIPRKRPIKLKELADKVAEKHKDSNLHFAREYDDLKALCAKHSTETSETDSNKLKNRYVNILPFDHSRVKLMLTEDDDPSTDFINANYLPGYKSPREYIATQGPIPGTIDDFWRMIWEQNVSIIVMLTLCKEEGRVKCEMYWPENTNEPKQYGDLVVETVSNSTVNFYDFRIFKIKLGDTTRSVKHFHFLQWKDFSANVQNDVMIDFIKNVRNHIRPPDMNGPVVVHCSAGVGRTGTYCALDHLFQFIDEHELDESIDIFDLVMNLREQRMCMVQTEQQYVFIHDCVRDYVERKQREMNGNQLYENVNRAFVHDDVEEDESLYQNYNNQRTDL